MFAFLGNMGPTEWIVILVIVLLLFGGRIPSLARSLGRSVVEFKRGVREVKDEMDNAGSGPDAADARPGASQSSAPAGRRS